MISLIGTNLTSHEIATASCEPSCSIKNNQFLFVGPLNP
jgi:hypothetical protein